MENKENRALVINHKAVWILIVFSFVVSFAWYSQYFFGNEMANLKGKQMADFNNAGIKPFVVSIISSIVTIYILAWVLKKLQVRGFIKGVFYSLVFWFGFMFCEGLETDQFEMRKYALTWINAGRTLLTFAVSGFVLGVWTKYSNAEEVKEAGDYLPPQSSPGSEDEK